MKTIALFIIGFIMVSCSVERRIHNWSYTNEWHHETGNRYQVYKTIDGRKYIIVIDQDKLILKRKYIKQN